MSDAGIIDQDTFSTYFECLGNDIDFLNELVETYLSSSTVIFARMHEALGSGQASVLQREAHSLKSGSASFGALGFAAQCKELEDIGRSGDLQSAPDKLLALEDAYAAVVAALHAQVDRVSR